MKLIDKTDEEILEIANPLWDDLVKYSNKKDYFGFVKDFSAKMLFGANEVETNTISVRHRNRGDLGALCPEEFISRFADEVSSRSL